MDEMYKKCNIKKINLALLDKILYEMREYVFRLFVNLTNNFNDDHRNVKILSVFTQTYSS